MGTHQLVVCDSVGRRGVSYSCEETYDVYRETVRKARKEHTCSACKETIRKGELYCSVFTVFDGVTDSLKRCGACQTTHKHLRAVIYDRDYDHDQLWPDERLNCGMSYEEEWGDCPADIAALAFVTSEERGKLLANAGCREARGVIRG